MFRLRRAGMLIRITFGYKSTCLRASMISRTFRLAHMNSVTDFSKIAPWISLQSPGPANRPG
jgi:hypothetical protein